MDVLTDILNSLELKGWLCTRMVVGTPWRIDFAASQDCIFHILNATGGGFLCVEGHTEPVRIEDGDVLLFPGGQAHTLCDELASPLLRVAHLDYHTHHEYQIASIMQQNADPSTKAVLLCGAFHFAYPHDYPLLQYLPEFIHIPGEQGRMKQDFMDIVQLIARESQTYKPGSETMLQRLTEMLFIQVIRLWIEQQTHTGQGWLGALHDQAISTALGLIHQTPAHGWKVEELADAVALSRSAFSARFTQLVGEPPIQYLTHWRMHLATRLLKNNVHMDTIAAQLGYDSEAAFRKAFRREMGMPPARYRKLASPASQPENEAIYQ